MTGLLILACGALVVVFTQLGRTRKAVVRQGLELGLQKERILALERVAAPPRAPAERDVEPAPVVAWPLPVTVAEEPASAEADDRPPAPAAVPRPAGPGVGTRVGTLVRSGWDQWVAQNLLAAAGGVFVLLGAAFFVAIAIHHGWLTPWRQVSAALVGGSLLLVAGWSSKTADLSLRTSQILAQSLVGTGAGVLVLAVVAGARIYDQPLYPTFAGLLATGAVSGIVVAISLRWNAQLTAGLGIASAVAAPFLVDAPSSVATLAFSLVALGGAAAVIAWRGWPWLLQVALVGSLLQPARWATEPGHGHTSAALGLGMIVAWWALLALPALLFEVRARSLRLRMPTSGALFELASLAVIAGRLAFGSVHAPAFELLLCVLAGLHLLAGALMLYLRPPSRPGAVFVWAVGAALAAGAGAVLLGGAAQPAFWAVETIAMLWLYLRSSDRQAGLTAGLLGLLSVGFAIWLAPPVALVFPLAGLATGVLALAAVVALLVLAAFLLRARRDLAAGLATAAWVGLAYGVAVLLVGLIASDRDTVDQASQLVVSGAWAALALALAVVATTLPARLRRAARLMAELTLWTVAVKALAFDSLGLGAHQSGVLWLLAALGVVATVLVAIERRLPASEVPLATPLLALLVVSALTQPGLDAYRAGTPHLLATLGVLAVALAGAGLAVWRLPVRFRADAFVLVVMFVTQAVALTTVTLVTPRLGVTSELAQRAISVGPLALALVLLAVRQFVRRLPVALRTRVTECSVGLLALASSLTVGDTIAYGATAGAVTVGVAWLIVSITLSLVVRPRERDRLLLVAACGAVSMCAFVLVTTGPPRAIAYGAAHGWRLLAAAAIATLAGALAARCAPVRWRTEALAGALAVALYGTSVLVVTGLAADAYRVDQAAQLALSILWTLWGVGLLGVGVTRRSPLGLFLRRSGIGLTSVAAAKVLIVDTSHFDTAHRAAVFLALGLILLAGAYAYARLTRGLEAV